MHCLDKMQQKIDLSINIIANAALGPAMSGGDRIFIECARRWALEHLVTVFVWEEGYQMCQRNNLENVNLVVWPAARYKKFGFPFLYLVRTVKGCLQALKLDVNTTERKVIYSASDFWPDSLPASILKLRFRDRIKWIAGFYLFAPKPWQKDSPYKGKNFFRGLFYWLMQLPIYWIVKKYADNVFVTSEPDVKKFVTKRRDKDKIMVVHGGVDISPSKRYLESGKVIPLEDRKYDACFVGRFHPQKGVLELIDIWKLICEERSTSKLAMIGGGPLENRIRKKIKDYNLEANIDLLGFKDGEEKFEIFKQSKIIVHPAIYDSGGMAAAEAMAWGLPAVSFDLEALKTYYPKGMLKTLCFDLKAFGVNIIRLLEDKDLYARTKEDAIAWAREWDWDKRAGFIFDKIFI